MFLSRSLIRIAFAAIIALSSTAASASPDQHGLSAPAPSGKGHGASRPPAIGGKVVETMDAGGYTYVCLERAGKKTWVAVPAMQVEVGKEMLFAPGQEMTDFTSKTLNRTFESIIFSDGPIGGKGDPHGGAMTSGGGGVSKAAVSPLEKGVRIEKAKGKNAYTVAEVFAKAKSLNNKQVLVHAKVVKVSEGIMGRNWIHLQDGTGDEGKKTNNLVATSQELPAVGDIVTIKGTVIKDKDFGAGYTYKVILEESTVQP